MIVGITGLIGVLTGAVVVYIGMILQMRHLENKEQRRRELELKVKEIETLNQLNKKINEILQKRMHLMIVISRLTILRISNHFQRKIVFICQIIF